jgi:transcriptional regulator with XRE-family HTH domain
MQVIIEQEFTQIVKTELAERGWSMRELARQMDVNVSYVSQYLSGKHTPGPDVMERILRCLDLVPHLSVTKTSEKISSVA